MARAEYGYINSNSLMSIKLLNGEVVNLFAEGGDIGQIDNEKIKQPIKPVSESQRNHRKCLALH